MGTVIGSVISTDGVYYVYTIGVSDVDRVGISVSVRDVFRDRHSERVLRGK